MIPSNIWQKLADGAGVEYKLTNPVDGSNKIVVYQDSSLGKGATATVYKSSINGRHYAAKIYHDKNKLNTKKIEAMIANPPDNLTGETAGVVYPRYSWPLSIIEDGSGNSVGYVMPLIDLQESFTLDHYYDKNLGKKLNSPDEVALSYKIEIAANLSRLISHLHSHGHYFIDFKPQNIRVFKRTHAVTLIDCDGFSIKSPAGQTYPAELLSTDYISPEAFRGHKSASELSEDQDRYALATIIFQLLNGGIHPFQGITTGQISAPTNDEKAAQGLYPHGLVADQRIQPRPQSIHNCLDDSTRALFDKAFMGLPTHRPSAIEWANHLDGLLKNKMLARCDQHPYDIRHMKFIGKDCPECQLQKIQVAKPAKQKPSIKLPPISNDSFSSPIPSAVPTGMDPGVKAMLVGLGLAILFAIILGMVMSGNSSPSSSSATVKYGPTSVRYTPQELGKYANEVNTIHNESDTKTVTHQSGDKVSWKAHKLLAPGWTILEQRDAPYYQLALKLNTESYELGHPEGASNIGYIYEHGLGVPRNYQTAASWYQKAINMGNPHSAQAEIHLAELYQYGKLGSPDLVKAKQLYDAALIQADRGWPGSRDKNHARIEANLKKIRQIGASPNYSNPASVNAASEAPFGYASVYFDPASLAFSWVTGYETQQKADYAAKASCAQRGALSTCTKNVGGPYKCLAIYFGDKYRVAQLGDSMEQVLRDGKSSCEKSNGGQCYVPPEGSTCAKLTEKPQPKSDVNKVVPPTSGVNQPTETIGWITAVYPKYGYIEFDVANGKYPYAGQVLVSSYSGRKYRIAKINGKRASAEPLESSTPILNEVGYSLMQ